MQSNTKKTATCIAFLTGLLISTQGNAYSFRTSQNGKTLLWGKNTAKITINTGAVSDVPGAADAVQAAFVTWTAAGMPMDLSFKASEKEKVQSSDGKNGVIWLTDEWPYANEVVAMTVSMYQRDSGIVSETDILLNARNFQWTTSPLSGDSRYDIQNVMTHEVGHFFGLGHEDKFADSAMYPTTPPGETTKRSLSVDDRAGLVALIGELEQRDGVEMTAYREAPPEIPAPVEETQENTVPQRGAVGCSIDSELSGQGWWSILLVLGVISLLQRRRRWIPILVLVLTPATSQASVVRMVPLTEMVEMADVILEGKVIEKTCYQDNWSIYTAYQIQVTHCHKGSCSPVMVLHALGGELADRGMQVEGMPRLTTNDHIFLLGRKTKARRLTIIGASLGLFRVTGKNALRDLSKLHLLHQGMVRPGRAEAIPVMKLREQVKKAIRQLELR